MPLDGDAEVFCDNNSVVNKSIITTSVLNKSHNGICYNISQQVFSVLGGYQGSLTLKIYLKILQLQATKEKIWLSQSSQTQYPQLVLLIKFRFNSHG